MGLIVQSDHLGGEGEDEKRGRRRGEKEKRGRRRGEEEKKRRGEQRKRRMKWTG